MKTMELNHPLQIYNVKEGKLIYRGPLYSVGLPVQGEPGLRATLFNVNRNKWMSLTNQTAIFEMRQIRLSDMKVLRKCRLKGTSSDLNHLAENYWSSAEGPLVHFDWSKDKSVEILGTRFETQN